MDLFTQAAYGASTSTARTYLVSTLHLAFSFLASGGFIVEARTSTLPRRIESCRLNETLVGYEQGVVVKLTEGNCAVIVVDMQYDFLTAGCPSAAPAGMEIVPDLHRLIVAARSLGLSLVYTQESHRPTQRDYGIELEYEQPHCVQGTRGHDIIDELAPSVQDLIVSKRRYDAFFGTDLDLLLREMGVKNVIITGVCTQYCRAGNCHARPKS